MNWLWYEVALAALWGGLVALERRAFLQAMLSRPLVAATGMGLLLDDVPAGLMVGMLLELYYLGSAALGAALPEHDTLAATGTAAMASTLAHATSAGSTPAIWSAALLLATLLGRAGRLVDRGLEHYSTRLARKALASAEQGDLPRAVRQNLWGMWLHFALFGLATAACAALGALIEPLYAHLPLSVLRGLAWAYPAMACVAAGLAARGSRARRAAIYAGVSAGLVACLALWLALRRGL